MGSIASEHPVETAVHGVIQYIIDGIFTGNVKALRGVM